MCGNVAYALVLTNKVSKTAFSELKNIGSSQLKCAHKYGSCTANPLSHDSGNQIIRTSRDNGGARTH